MVSISDIFQDFQDTLFRSVVSDRLVYNTCWEDPRVDRALLEIDRDSRMVVLTSAGCNSYDYLLDNPAELHCVDANPSQNALLELKQAIFKNCDYVTLWNFFGKGHHRNATHTYRKTIAACLSEKSRQIWNRRINYFTSNANELSFYFRGTTGKVALMVRNHIRRKGLFPDVQKLLDSKTLAKQDHYFTKVEEQLGNTLYDWLISRPLAMALLGVPAAQINMINENFEHGLNGFIRSSIRRIFTRRPIRDNYFWRVYLMGSYTPECCPNYLKKKHFTILRGRMNRIVQHTCHLSQFLRKHPGNYSHFVLLDHQDWLVPFPDLLVEEWRLILDNSCPGTRILFRSAGTSADFLPGFVREQVDFEQAADKISHFHRLDRVGTYGSTHLGVVTS